MKKINYYTGIILIISGFIIPKYLMLPIPYILYFYLGLMFLLKRDQSKSNINIIKKYAQIMITIHFIGTALQFTAYYLYFLNHSNMITSPSHITQYLDRIINPSTRLVLKVFPQEMTNNIDGSVTVITNPLVTSLYSFSNITIYLLFGIVFAIVTKINSAEKVNTSC